MNLKISETTMVTLGLYPANIVSLGCILFINDFHFLFTLWVFTVDVPLMEKLAC